MCYDFKGFHGTWQIDVFYYYYWMGQVLQCDWAGNWQSHLATSHLHCSCEDKPHAGCSLLLVDAFHRRYILPLTLLWGHNGGPHKSTIQWTTRWMYICGRKITKPSCVRGIVSTSGPSCCRVKCFNCNTSFLAHLIFLFFESWVVQGSVRQNSSPLILIGLFLFVLCCQFRSSLEAATRKAQSPQVDSLVHSSAKKNWLDDLKRPCSGVAAQAWINNMVPDR